MKKKALNYLLLIIMLFSVIPVNIKAEGEPNVGEIVIGGTEMEVGEKQTLTIGLSASNVASVDGYIESNDPSCVKVVSVDSKSGNPADNYFMDITQTSTPVPNGGTVTIEGLKVCETTLKVYNASIASQDEEEGTELTFTSGTIKVGAAKSKDANLSGLTVSKGSLSPAFDKDTTSYTVEVDNDVDSIEIEATANDDKASVDGTGTKSLSVGDNSYSIVVTAENGSKKTYTIKVTRASASEEEKADATLSELTVSKGSLSPAFDKKTTSYTVTVDNDVDSIEIGGTASDEDATIDGLGTKTLAVGDNLYNITVTATDGTKKIYTIKVTRAKKEDKTQADNNSKSSENRLRSMILSNGILSPSFDPNLSNYNVVIASDVNELNFSSLVPMNSKARYSVSNNGNFVVGETKVVSIVVTAEDGSQRIYTINVNKSDKKSNNKLSELTISGGTLDPAFNSNTTSYNAKVASNTKSISVNAKTENDKATIEYSVNGSKFSSDNNFDLQDGNNVIMVKVTDENGFVQLYSINVEKPSNTFSLFGIKIPKWLGYLLLLLLLGLIGWLIFLVLKKRRERAQRIEMTQAVPNIEIKPEFNFNSKNEDNDSVDDGGVLNQNSSGSSGSTQDNDENSGVSFAKDENDKKVPYDPYDEVVTKDEIIDAINEKDTDKLRILYKQEMLNKEKEKLKSKEEAKDEKHHD